MLKSFCASKIWVVVNLKQKTSLTFTMLGAIAVYITTKQQRRNIAIMVKSTVQ